MRQAAVPNREQLTIRSAILLGAKKVIAIDDVSERLKMAKAGGAITINFEDESVVERLNDLTDGKGPEKCIDAVGMEAHAGGSFDAVYDKLKQSVMLETDRPHVLREMMYVAGRRAHYRYRACTAGYWTRFHLAPP